MTGVAQSQYAEPPQHIVTHAVLPSMRDWRQGDPATAPHNPNGFQDTQPHQVEPYGDATLPLDVRQYREERARRWPSDSVVSSNRQKLLEQPELEDVEHDPRTQGTPHTAQQSRPRAAGSDGTVVWKPPVPTQQGADREATAAAETKPVTDDCGLATEAKQFLDELLEDPAYANAEIPKQIETWTLVCRAKQVFLFWEPTATDIATATASKCQIKTSLPRFKMAHNLDLRCVLLPAPICAWVTNQNTSRIQTKEASTPTPTPLYV